MRNILAVLLIALAALVAVAVVAAALLGLGTLLALLFPVTAWQATIVVMGAAAGVVWFLTRLVPPAPLYLDDLDALDEEPSEEPPIVVLPEFPLNRPRGRRRRKR
jgi:hypothetical protein